MNILWYPKSFLLLHQHPDYLFEGTNRMRVYEFHACYRECLGLHSDIAGFTLAAPNPFDYEAVVFTKGGPSPLLAGWLKRSGILTVWDQCDPLTRLPKRLGGSVDLMLTNSDELAGQFTRLGATVPVRVIHDQHEADLSRPRVHTASQRLRVTWYGWRANFESFVRPLLPMLQSLDFVDFAWAGRDSARNRQEPGFTSGIEMGLDWREAWRRPDSWLNFIRNSDVGMVPVADGEIKPQHKILNYMAYGIPVVCSPTDAYRRIVRHGENGFIAQTEDDWVRYLALLRDPDLRDRIGRQARADVGEQWKVEAVAQRHYALLTEAAARKHEPARSPSARARRALGRGWYPAYLAYQRWRYADLGHADWEPHQT